MNTNNDDFFAWLDACCDHGNDVQLRSPDILCDYLAQFFEHPEIIDSHRTNDECAVLVWSLFGAASGITHQALSDSVDLAKRRRWLRSMTKLYDWFDRRLVSINDEAIDRDSFATAVYMIWDMDTLGVAQSHPVLADDAAYVLKHALASESASCIRSALHGLGHWIGCTRINGLLHRRLQLVQMIDDFIRQNPYIDQRIINYARLARTDTIM